MDNLGISLLIGATLSSAVPQVLNSLKSKTTNTIKSIDKIEIAKRWADNLLKIKSEIEANEREMKELGATAERIKLKQNLIAELESSKVKASEFGINLGNAASKSKELAIEIEKAEKAAKKLELNANAKEQFSKTTAEIAKLTAGIFATKTAFMSAVRPAVNFEKEMNFVGTLVDTTAVDMGKLSDSALNLSKDYGVAMDTVTSGMYQALSAGVDGY